MDYLPKTRMWRLGSKPNLSQNWTSSNICQLQWDHSPKHRIYPKLCWPLGFRHRTLTTTPHKTPVGLDYVGPIHKNYLDYVGLCGVTLLESRKRHLLICPRPSTKPNCGPYERRRAFVVTRMKIIGVFNNLVFFSSFFLICIQLSNCEPGEWRRVSINIRVRITIIMLWDDIIRVFGFLLVFSCPSFCVNWKTRKCSLLLDRALRN